MSFNRNKKTTPILGWVKLSLGLLILTAFLLLMTTGYAPPGILGDVIRHNQAHDIDASPFFYGDVENMTELEEGLKELMEEQRRERCD